jgi:broad specificity phosphatase PhoE
LADLRAFVARHGETEWNLSGREMGQLDSALTPRGLEQADALARHLAGTGIELVYSSDLGRAQHTGEIISAVCRVELVVEPGLRERNSGIFQGLTVAEMDERYPTERREYRTLGYEYVIPNGESARQRTERSVQVMTGIALRHPLTSVAVVTHGGFLKGFTEHVLGIGTGNGARYRHRNGGLSVFVHEERGWTLESWNDTSHLGEVGSLDDLRTAGFSAGYE